MEKVVRNNKFVYLMAGLIVLGLLLLIFRKPRQVIRKIPVIKKVMITPTPTRTIPAFFRGFSTSDVLERPTPTAGQSAQPAQQSQIQEIHNDGTSAQLQSPQATPIPNQPTSVPQPTRACIVNLLGLCL